MQNVHLIEQTESTNDVLKSCLAADLNLPSGYTVWTKYQTAGRGQQGNSWESEKDKNLLFSTLFRLTNVPVERQFLLSELVAVGIANVLAEYTSGISIKWPNDIYWHDKKIAGILIENSLLGNQISSSVVGVGVNINQQKFVSNAPNPVSLAQITGKEYDLETLLYNILEEFENLSSLLNRPEKLKELYWEKLYRRDGWYKWQKNQCSSAPIHIVQDDSTEAFVAKIKDVKDNGLLELELPNGEQMNCHFKEIKYIINTEKEIL